MRGIAITIAGLVAGVATTCPVRAGLYNTAEPRPVLSRNYRVFQDTLIVLRQIGIPTIQSPLNRRFELVAALASSGGANTLSTEQRLDLSDYWIRLRKYREAINLLRPILFKEPDNFLVVSNLATAQQLDGQLQEAGLTLSDTLRLWPKEWSNLSEARRTWFTQIGWNKDDFGWYREAETYQLKLVRLRAREALRKQPGQRPAGRQDQLPESPDGIFDGAGAPAALRFVGESGKFEAGKLAAAERAKLPGGSPEKAIKIVEQLLVWMPHDTRLEWLLGELFNAQGDVPAAQKIFKDVANKWNPPPSTPSSSGFGFQRPPPLPQLFKEHLAVLQARPLAEDTVAEPVTTAGSRPPPAAPPPAAATGPVEWKSLAVGFGVGLLVAFFGYWQIREIRRRRL